MNDSNIPNHTEGKYPESNFNNFVEAFLTVFIILRNDGWSTIFFYHAKGSKYSFLAYWYFTVLLCFGQFILLNLIAFNLL